MVFILIASFSYAGDTLIINSAPVKFASVYNFSVTNDLSVGGILYISEIKATLTNMTIVNQTTINATNGYFLNRVGIGTTSPAYKLDINGGSIAVKPTGTEVFRLWSADGTARLMFLTNSPTGSASIYYYTTSFQGIQIGRNDATIPLYVDGGNARVGIGTTSPAYPLQINSSSTNEYQLGLARTGSSTNWAFGMDSTGMYIADRDNAQIIMNWEEGGNVGIGTTSPSDKFHVVSGMDYILFNFTGGLPQIEMKDSSSSKVLLKAYGSDFRVETGGSNRLTVDSSGNVGIGTTSPNAKLQVIGNVNITGNINISGCIAYNGGTLGTCI